ncbi:MAG TPA: glycoside hydrolase, partial [Actinopolymorphaceae bacterium]|nr:glycoside hydrolase [Actinopolymorphaceae bacterium]
MARIKLAYLGGGSTRAAGTMASFVHHGHQFEGSEVVLIDLDADRLALIKQLADTMAKHAGLDLTVTATTDRREGLRDCDAVLSSFRPGGFEARALDERIPLKHGVIGQETQGPGGFFMALRSIAVMKGVADDLAAVAPGVRIFNYTNPVNIVAQGMTTYTDIPTVSLCEGPIIFPRGVAEAAGLDPDRLEATMVGINHNCWSTEHLYDGENLIPHLKAGLEARAGDPA